MRYQGVVKGCVTAYHLVSVKSKQEKFVSYRFITRQFAIFAANKDVKRIDPDKSGGPGSALWSCGGVAGLCGRRGRRL